MKTKQRFISLAAVVAKNLIELLSSSNLNRNLNVNERIQLKTYLCLLQTEVAAAHRNNVRVSADLALGILKIFRIIMEDEKDFKKLIE